MAGTPSLTKPASRRFLGGLGLTLRVALASLAAHKLRAAMAILGVFLGALALTGVRHVTLGMVRKAELETEKLGPNLFMAVSGQVRFRRGGAGARLGPPARTFTIGDALALARGLPGALRMSPYLSSAMPITGGDVTVTCQLVGVWPEYAAVRASFVEFGRFITADDLASRAKVCVLGRTIAERLFGTAEKALGREVQLFRAPCRVIGVMEAKGADIVGADQDEQVFVPLSTFQRRFANQTWITGVSIQMASGDLAEASREPAAEILRLRHNLTPGGKDDFSLVTGKDALTLQRQALELVQTLGTISSSICFAVGGLGIFSIMVLLVRARRLEIGVRRATGANRGHVARQFLLESGLMSATGGILGVAGGLGVALIVFRLADFPTVLDPTQIAAVLAGSMALGLVAGGYPAWKASRVDVLATLSAEG